MGLKFAWQEIKNGEDNGIMVYDFDSVEDAKKNFVKHAKMNRTRGWTFKKIKANYEKKHDCKIILLKKVED